MAFQARWVMIRVVVLSPCWSHGYCAIVVPSTFGENPSSIDSLDLYLSSTSSFEVRSVSLENRVEGPGEGGGSSKSSWIDQSVHSSQTQILAFSTVWEHQIIRKSPIRVCHVKWVNSPSWESVEMPGVPQVSNSKSARHSLRLLVWGLICRLLQRRESTSTVRFVRIKKKKAPNESKQ